MLIEQLPNVTVPATAVLELGAQVNLPAGLPLPLVMVNVTVFVLPNTILLAASRTVTTIAGSIDAPEGVFVGCTLITSCEAAGCDAMVVVVGAVVVVVVVAAAVVVVVAAVVVVVAAVVVVVGAVVVAAVVAVVLGEVTTVELGAGGAVVELDETEPPPAVSVAPHFTTATIVNSSPLTMTSFRFDSRRMTPAATNSASVAYRPYCALNTSSAFVNDLLSALQAVAADRSVDPPTASATAAVKMPRIPTVIRISTIVIPESPARLGGTPLYRQATPSTRTHLRNRSATTSASPQR